MKKIWAILGIMPALCGLQIDPKVIKPLDHYEMDFSHWIVRSESPQEQKVAEEKLQEQKQEQRKAAQKRVRVQKKNLTKLNK